MIVYATTIRSFNFTAKMIHFGMGLGAVLRNIKPQKCRNHAEIRYGFYTSGAIAEGVKTRLGKDYMSSHKKITYNYKIELTDEQGIIGKTYLQKVENSPYEFENFGGHLVKIITGKGRGSSTSRQTYCYEHLLRFLNVIGYNVDIYLNPYEAKIGLDSTFGEPIIEKNF